LISPHQASQYGFYYAETYKWSFMALQGKH